VQRPGSYRVAVRYSPYWLPSQGCVEEGPDEMLRLVASRAGPVSLRFDFQEGVLLGPFGASETAVCP
jgi:hypothetical protein